MDALPALLVVANDDYSSHVGIEHTARSLRRAGREIFGCKTVFA